MRTSFGVTYDYRCPFARNAHEYIVAALRAGADWDVDFIPFSLSRIHDEEGDTPVWEDARRAPDLLALEVSVAVADIYPDRFLDVHEALFAARHDQARDLRDQLVVLDVLNSAGLDGTAVLERVADGSAHFEVQKRHESAASEHQVFGVPTFITGHDAAFVRLMGRPKGDGELATRTIERLLDLIGGQPDINELKHTTVPN
jgi:hypothetical protein